MQHAASRLRSPKDLLHPQQHHGRVQLLCERHQQRGLLFDVHVGLLFGGGDRATTTSQLVQLRFDRSCQMRLVRGHVQRVRRELFGHTVAKSRSMSYVGYLAKHTKYRKICF